MRLSSLKAPFGDEIAFPDDATFACMAISHYVV